MTRKGPRISFAYFLLHARFPYRFSFYQVDVVLYLKNAPPFTTWTEKEKKWKNDRMNSGGTLRQKFNLIDIWHYTINIQPMDQLTNWPLD